jgi:hypothetical protein
MKGIKKRNKGVSPGNSAAAAAGNVPERFSIVLFLLSFVNFLALLKFNAGSLCTPYLKVPPSPCPSCIRTAIGKGKPGNEK